MCPFGTSAGLTCAIRGSRPASRTRCSVVSTRSRHRFMTGMPPSPEPALLAAPSHRNAARPLGSDPIGVARSGVGGQRVRIYSHLLA